MLTVASDAVLPPVTTASKNPLADGLRLASTGLTSLVVLITATVIFGWATGRDDLKSVFPGTGPMKANTALAMLFTAAASWMYQRQEFASLRDQALRVFAGISLAIAAVTLVEHLTGWNLFIDQLIFTDHGSFGAPGRMALSTAVSLVFVNTALLIADGPGRFGAAQILTGGALFLSMLSSVGFFFGVDVFTGLASYTAMALHTSGCLAVICASFFFARPTDGVMSIVSDQGPSGFVVRRLLPPVFIVPVILAWLSRQGELAGYYGAEFSMTFFTVSAITALSGVVWAGGTMLRGLEARRESSERQRVQSEERLRLAVTDAPVPMVIHDADRILHMSRGWSETSGYTIDDTPTITAWTMKAQGPTQEHVKAYVDQLGGAAHTVYGGESRITARTGTERVWDFSTTPLSRPGTENRTFLTIAVDVTERHRAQAELREVNQDLELRIAERTRALTDANDALRRQSDQLKEQAALLDLAHEGIIVRDLYGTIVYWNAGATELYGWTREQALGQVSHALLKAVYPTPVAEIEKHALEHGHWEGEIVHTTSDGRHLAIESHWTLTRTERGTPQGFLELNRDITAKQLAEDSLRDSESRFRAVAETANEGIVTADVRGVIRYWNPGAARMFARPESGAVGQSLALMVPNREHRAFLEALAPFQSSQGGGVPGRTVELVGVRSNDEEFPIEISLASFASSKGAFLSIILRDITSRKHAEQTLKETNADLARSNQELEQFAYVASHDLQEPLRMVSNYTQLLGRRYKDQLDTDAQEFIGFAVDGAIRMQALIHDLLQYARVGTRGKEFKTTPVGDVVRDAVANLGGAIEESGAEITIDTLPTIACDASQLTQVFQNLMGNALKFRKPNTKPAVRVSAVRAERAWSFAIEDNGIGIEPKYFERIFNMFQRLHARDEYPGTGIGLALCKKIVERHGGVITVASEPGRGTTFSFTIADATPVTRSA